MRVCTTKIIYKKEIIMKNIAVIYGGESCERDISIITATQAMNSIKNMNFYPIYICEQGLYILKNPLNLKEYTDIDLSKQTKVTFLDKSLYKVVKNKKLKKLSDIDSVLLCTHGGKGENGSVQGYLETLNIPYTSCNHRTSQICMDKSDFKQYCTANKINTLPYVTVNNSMSIDKCVKVVTKKLDYPIMVKPCSQGSSIGIAMAKDIDDLEDALETAFEFDSKVICEKGLKDFTELNCAVILRNGEYIVSELEQPTVWSDYLSFDDKYVNGKSVKFPAEVDSVISQLAQKTATDLYKGLDAFGVVRVDFLYDNVVNKLYVNEMNTIPGSLANYLFADKGIDFNTLIDILVDESITRKENELKPNYKTDILSKFTLSNACKGRCKKL